MTQPARQKWGQSLTTIGNTWRGGFTGHEHLDSVGLIHMHMNGQVYDPVVARFLSRDPFIDGVDSSQGPNGYAYVHNNPLAKIDPTGFVGYCSADNPCQRSDEQFSAFLEELERQYVRHAPQNHPRDDSISLDDLPPQSFPSYSTPMQRPLVVFTGLLMDSAGGSTVSGNAIGVLSGGVAYIVSDELVGDYSCAKTGQCQIRPVVRPDCNVFPAYKHSSCEAVYPSAAIENTILAGVSAFSLVRAAVAANAPEAVIGRLAQAHANSGRQALAAYMSDLEAAAVQAGSRATPAILGQAVHTATARSLAQIYPGKYLYYPRAPFDFVYVPTGQVFELTTLGQAGSHAARGADLIFYTLPR